MGDVPFGRHGSRGGRTGLHGKWSRQVARRHEAEREREHDQVPREPPYPPPGWHLSMEETVIEWHRSIHLACSKTGDEATKKRRVDWPAAGNPSGF